MKKVLLSLLMLTVGVTSMNSQTVKKEKVNHYNWMVSLSANSVDFRTPSEFTSVLKDYVGLNDQNFNALPLKVSLERKLNKSFSVQFDASYNEITKPFGYQANDVLTDTSFLNLGLKANYDLNNLVGETGFFDPYLSLGGAWNKLGKDYSDVKLNLGYGANLWISEKVGVKLESSYNHAFNANGTDFFQHSVGVAYRFGRNDSDKDGVADADDLCPNVAGLAEFSGCPDSDADGIKDSEDKCPNVPGDKVFNGCPDSDGDGIINKEDKCPEQAGGKDNNGCPWGDYDGDKIADNVDKCPKVAGPASRQGCPEPKVEKPDCSSEFNLIATTEVFFAFDKSTLDEVEKNKLNNVGNVLKSIKCAVNVLSLKGYTDVVGTKAYNLKLSTERCNVVKLYLESIGVKNIDIQGEGFGETKSRGEGRNKDNRRVEFGIK